MFSPSDHITTTSPSIASLHTILCSFSVTPASLQEFSLAAGSTENHRLSPKTHKVPHQTRSAINYLKLKSPSAWRWKRPLRLSTASSERTDGGIGRALRSPCQGEERGLSRRRLIWKDGWRWLMKHGRCLPWENILISWTERGVANAKGYADTLHIRRITRECSLCFSRDFQTTLIAQNAASVECTYMWRQTEDPALGTFLHSIWSVCYC